LLPSPGQRGGLVDNGVGADVFESFVDRRIVQQVERLEVRVGERHGTSGVFLAEATTSWPRLVSLGMSCRSTAPVAPTTNTRIALSSLLA
jgi:hypothetical protein